MTEGRGKKSERGKKKETEGEKKSARGGTVLWILFTTYGSPAFYFAFTSYATLERLRAPLFAGRGGGKGERCRAENVTPLPTA